MRRSSWFTAVRTAALGATILIWASEAGAGNQNLLGSPEGTMAGTFNSVPFQGTVPQGSKTPPRTSEAGNPNPSSPPSGSPGTTEREASGAGNGSRSLGSLFELNRQETLLKREIAIKRLKDQLKGAPAKKILDTGKRGSPVTLLAAGLEGRRYAVLSWPDGRRIRVRQGETLPDGTRVVGIDGSGVSVRKHGKTVTYPYGESDGRRQDAPRFSGFSPPPPPSRMTGGRP